VKRALIIGAVVVVLAAVVVASLRRGGGETGTPVDAEAAAEREIRRVVRASGVVDPREKVELSAHVVAKIDQLYVEEGDQVEAGEPVLELERQVFDAAVADWRARLAQARSAVRKAEADLESARLRRQRYERLAGEGVVSDEQVEEARVAATGAEVALDQAGESVAQARANLAKAEDDLRKTTIYAPIGGRVIALNAEQGEVVVSGTMNNPASVIATLADLSEVLAVVDVDETEIVHVAVGQDAELEVDAMPERSFAGRVVEVGSSGFSRPDQRDVTFFKVKVLFEEPAEALKPGMSVRASIVTAVHTSALVVPIQAVVERPPLAGDGEAGAGGDEEEVRVVFVVADGEARQRPVDTGISDATHVEITTGLAAGEPVVTGPYRVLRKLEDGEAVRVDTEEEDDDGDGDDDGDEAAEEPEE
jgi:HlyD family secretion protein